MLGPFQALRPVMNQPRQELLGQTYRSEAVVVTGVICAPQGILEYRTNCPLAWFAKLFAKAQGFDGHREQIGCTHRQHVSRKIALIVLR